MISVIIPVKNGVATLESCLLSLCKQKSVDDLEIIILDSESNDGSVELAKKYHTKVIPIQLTKFNHGLTRNIGVQCARYPLVFFTVQDAVLTDEFMLSRMATHFSDSKVKAVCGHQAIIIHQKTNPFIWFKPISKSCAKEKTALLIRSNKNLRSYIDQFNWDNVNAMYRKDILLKIPFTVTDYGEDHLWCREALNGGQKLIYDPSLVVHHYHHATFKYVFLDTFRNAYFVFNHYSAIPVIEFKITFLPKLFYRIILRSGLPLTEIIYWIFNNIIQQIAKALALSFFRMCVKFQKIEILHQFYTQYCSKNLQGTTRKA